MTQLKSRLLASFAGAGWSGCLQLACVPLLIGLMGAESYGLVGFYITLQVSLQILDLGLTPTLNRELARYSARPGTSAEARDFVWTMQCLCWGIGIAIGAGVFLLAPIIATQWIQPRELGADELIAAIRLMGLLVAVQWPLSLYHGGLTGLQQQVALNALRTGASTLSYGGAILVLWLVSPRVEAFFQWQIAVALVQVALTGTVLWRMLPASDRRARFDPALLSGVRRFSGEVAGIAMAGIVVSQMDKIILSRLLPLDKFGYYMIAGVLAGALQLFITPIFSVVYPRLSALVVSGETTVIRQLYHQATQLMAVLVLPTAIVLSMFAPQAVTLWTGNPAVASEVAPILVLLLAGTAINGLMHMPYALQLAHGWTRIGLQFAVFKVAVFLPLLVFAASHYGAVGGAAVWALLNVSYLALGVPLTHRRLLPGETGRWLITDVGYALVAIWLTAAVVHRMFDGEASGMLALAQLAVAGLAALAAAVLAAPDIRGYLLAGRLQLRPLRR